MEPNTDEFDIIIVGGGPAGTAAAMFAKRNGLSVCLVDKARFPRDKVCGDALSGKSIAVLMDLGLLEEVRKLPGAPVDTIVFGSPDHVDATIDLNRHLLLDLLTGREVPMEGFVIRRQVFDSFLFEKARAVVDECLEDCQIQDLIYEDDFVCGIEGVRNGQGIRRRGKIVFGCDGFNSVVARKSGLYRHDGKHWVIALRCYYENVKGLDGRIELHFVNEVMPGYFWAFPLENGCANIGIGMVHEYRKERRVDLKQALNEVIARPPFAERFADARPLEEPVGWNLPLGSIRRKSFGNGFLLLGDAAGLIDPFTGEGIGNALYSAKFAADTAAEAIETGDRSEAFLKRHEDRLWEVLGDELKTSKRLQDLGKWRFLLNMVIHKAARNPKISDLIGGMIANAVPKEQLANPLFYLKLLLK